MTKKSVYLRNSVAGAICLAGLTVFSGCNKDDDSSGSGDGNGGNASKITATNVINSSSRIVTVKAEDYWYSDYDVIAQAPYKNNGFTLELPATMAAKYLEPIEVEEGVTVSDRNAKYYELEEFSGFDKDDETIGYFYLGDEDDSNVSWLYVDRDVTVKGEYNYEDYTEKYDVKLKKGWNVVYVIITESYSKGKSVTSQKPSGINPQWYFDSCSDCRSAEVTTKSIAHTKSVFSQLKENKKIGLKK